MLSLFQFIKVHKIYTTYLIVREMQTLPKSSTYLSVWASASACVCMVQTLQIRKNVRVE